MKTYEQIAARLTPPAGSSSRHFDRSLFNTYGYLGLPEWDTPPTDSLAQMRTQEDFDLALQGATKEILNDIDLSQIYHLGGSEYAEAFYRNSKTSCARLVSELIRNPDVPIEAIRHCYTWHGENPEWKVHTGYSGEYHHRTGYEKHEYYDLVLNAFYGENDFVNTSSPERIQALRTALIEETPKITGESCDVGRLFRHALLMGDREQAAFLLKLMPDTQDRSMFDFEVDTKAAIQGHVDYFRRFHPKPQTGPDSPKSQANFHKLIMSAAHHDQLSVVQELWDRALPFDKEHTRKNLWDAATAALIKNPGLVACWLVEKQGFKPKQENEIALATALENGHTQTARFLHAAGARAQIQHSSIWYTSIDNLRFAHEICDLRETALLEDLAGIKLEPEKTDLLRELFSVEELRHEYSDAGSLMRILGDACQIGSTGMVHLLLDVGAKASNRTLFEATTHQDHGILKILLEKDARLDERFPEGYGLIADMHEYFQHVIPPEALPAMKLFREAGATLRASDIPRLPKAAELELYVELSRFKDGNRLLATELGPILNSAEKCREQWQKRVHIDPPAGLEFISPYGFKPSTFQTVSEWMRADMHVGPDSPRSEVEQVNRYANNLTVLFGTPDRVLQFFDKHGRTSKSPLHDLSQFKLPDEPGWDIAAWGDSVLKFGPSMTKQLKFVAKLGGKPLESLSKTREAVAKFVYARGVENPTLAVICHELEVDEDDFNAALDVHKTINVHNASTQTPDITLDGAEFGMTGYVWKRAPVGDPRILIAGETVNCCQHIGGVGEACAIHSATSENGCCYFLSKPDKNGENIVAISWGWTDIKGSFCLDSFEPIDPIYSKAFPRILESMAVKLQAEYPEITSFTVGVGGRTPQLDYGVVIGETTASPHGYSGYRDSEGGQYVVFGNPLFKEIAQRAGKDLESIGPSVGIPGHE